MHIGQFDIGILKEPGIPILYPNNLSSTSVELNYTSTGGTEYYIYYDVNPGPPYQGTGLVQGDSPINVGELLTYQLEGLEQCTKYYFSVKAKNELRI